MKDEGNVLVTSEEMESRPRRRLKAVRTIKQLFEAVGGKHGMVELTGENYTTVCNWLSLYKSIPARKYLRVQNHLKANGRIADPALFGMD